MGIVASAELMTFECIGCCSTYTGKARELAGLGWVRKLYDRRVAPNKGEVLLCKECAAHFESIWRMREQLK